MVNIKDYSRFATSIALRHLMGVPSVQSTCMIHQQQLNFMYSLPLNSLPHVGFEKRLASSPPLGIIPSLMVSLPSLRITISASDS